MSKMRVLLTAFHYPPEVSGGTPRMLSIEKHLVNTGAEVTLLTPQPAARGAFGAKVMHVGFPGYYSNRGEGKGRRPWYRRFAKRWILVPDVFITWTASAALKAAREHRRNPFDLVITSSPPESMHALGLALKSVRPCAWLADFCDGWMFEPLREEASLPLRANLERLMEDVVVGKCDFITAATRPIAMYLERRTGASQEKVMWLPPAFEEFYDGESKGSGSRFEMLYTGRFSGSNRRRGPGVFFEGLSAALEREPEMTSRFRLTVMGDMSSAEKALMASGAAAKVSRVLPAASHEEALARSASATMLLLVTAAGLTSVATRKLFDYLSVRRPVFALAAGNEAERIVTQTRSGMCVSPGEPRQVAAGLVRAFRLWRAGRLESTFPRDENHLYLAAPHLERTLGRVLASLSPAPEARDAKPRAIIAQAGSVPT